MSRPQRLIGLLSVLQSRRHTTAESLAREFGVSVRTVLRDIRTLADAGLPIVTGRGKYGGISLLPGSQVDLTRLTTAESDVLRAVGVDRDSAHRLGVSAAARGALSKLPRRPVRPGEPPLRLADVVTVDNRGWFAPDDHTDVAGLAQDLRRGVRLQLHYRPSGAPSAQPVRADPYGLLQRAGRWYLVADVGAQPRLFALSRLAGWEALPDARRLRPGATLDGVARELGRRLEERGTVLVTALLAADRLDLARRILGSRLRTAEPAPARSAASENAAEPAPTRSAESENTAGSAPSASAGSENTADPPAPEQVRITVAYEQLAGARQLLQFAGHLEVLDPPEARTLVRELALRVVQAHGVS